jgi:hypothetical protein
VEYIIGYAERNGVGVICSACEGKGYEEEEIEIFKEKVKLDNITKIYLSNPGVFLSENSEGGMPYKDWLEDKKFPKGSESRNHNCPQGFYQGANHNLCPNWKECESAYPTFQNCKQYNNKHLCWNKWDEEIGDKK